MTPLITFDPEDLRFGLTAAELADITPKLQQLMSYYYTIGPVCTIQSVLRIAEPIIKLMKSGELPKPLSIHVD